MGKVKVLSLEPAPDAEIAAPEEAEPSDTTDTSVEQLFQHVPANPSYEAPPGLRTARVMSMGDESAKIVYRGHKKEVEAEVDGSVDMELIAQAMKSGDRVLVEVDPELGPTIVGVIQTRVPREFAFKGRKVVMEVDDELLFRTEHAALRIRNNGDVELLGGRIHATSRGLFQLIGQLFRLN